VPSVAIVNPASAGGKAGRRWARLASLLSRRIGSFETVVTAAAGEATRLTREFLEKGFDRVIAVGGDGTFNEVANGFFEDSRPVRPEACLGIIPIGTAGDLRRTMGIPAGPRSVEVIAAGQPRAIDVGWISFVDHGGRPHSRCFLNLVSFGLGGEVALRVRRSPLPLNGTAKYLLFAAAVLLRKTPPSISLTVDERQFEPTPVTHVAVGNGRYHGGGMHVCPEARMDDGILDVTVVRGIGLPELLRNLPAVYNGRIYSHPKVDHLRGRKIEAAAHTPVLVEIDGEPLGRLPVQITVWKKALLVLALP